MVHDTPLTKEMSDSSDESGSTPEVPPLTSLTADGNCYKRSAPVECEIGKILRLPQSKWPGAARHVQNETLVFMVRQTRCADRDLHERLVDALEKRIFLIAGRLFGYLLSGAVLGIGFFMILFAGSALHDRIAETRVVRRRPS